MVLTFLSIYAKVGQFAKHAAFQVRLNRKSPIMEHAANIDSAVKRTEGDQDQIAHEDTGRRRIEGILEVRSPKLAYIKDYWP